MFESCSLCIVLLQLLRLQSDAGVFKCQGDIFMQLLGRSYHRVLSSDPPEVSSSVRVYTRIMDACLSA